jgi:hypothetical protein
MEETQKAAEEAAVGAVDGVVKEEGVTVKMEEAT